MRYIWRAARAQCGFTALIDAAYHGHADCARLLLTAGADKEAKTMVRASRFAAEMCCLVAMLMTRCVVQEHAICIFVSKFSIAVH